MSRLRSPLYKADRHSVERVAMGTEEHSGPSTVFYRDRQLFETLVGSGLGIASATGPYTGDKLAYPITAGNDEDKVATSSFNGKVSVTGVIHSPCRAKVVNDLPARKRADAGSDRHRRSAPCERGC